MRELKFRAWWKDTKRFLDGDEWYMTYSGAKHLHYSVYPYSDDDFIIEQYTGLKDKNGKEIYEGDIVRWSYKVDRNAKPTHTTDKVEWRTYEEEEWPYATISGFTLSESEDGYEVIGNIHENPELITEGEE